MHDAVIDYMTAQIAALDLDAVGSVLDFGGRDVNGTTRHLFPTAHYVAVDIAEAPNVDVVGNAADVELGELFDVVVATELLEHTPDGDGIVANAYRHLKPGGWFLATMAGEGRGPHGAGGEPYVPTGEWYENVTEARLTSWLERAGFATFSLDTLGADLRCWARKDGVR